MIRIVIAALAAVALLAVNAEAQMIRSLAGVATRYERPMSTVEQALQRRMMLEQAWGAML